MSHCHCAGKQEESEVAALLYNPPQFRTEDAAAALAAIAAQPFAMLVSETAEGPYVSHLPMLVEGKGTRLVGHIARANPHWKLATQERPALAVFSGPQAYISPNWYPSKMAEGKAVPTWNYTVVQVRGTLRWFDDAAELHGVVERLTDRFEAKRADPWALSDAPESYIAAMLRGIVGVELRISSIEAKEKLSQNRTIEDQDGVIAGLAGEAGAGPAAIRALMLARRPLGQ